MIPALSHTFVEIDHEIISVTILLPSTDSRRVVVSYKRKYAHEVLVNRLVTFAQEKSVVRCRDFPWPDFGPNNGTFPVKNEQKLPKIMVHIIPNFLVLHFTDFMIIRSKIPKLQMHENLHKNVNENIFSFTFLCKFSWTLCWAIKATNMLQLYTANFLYGF